jgi:hypothetical protein
MAISGIATGAATAYAPSQGPAPSAGQHKHGKHHASSISDVDAQSSSIATAASATGKIGSKVDITV